MIFKNQTMSNRLFLATIVIILGGSIAMVCCSQSTHVTAMAPLLNIATKKVDLGAITSAGIREILFPIENKGLCRLVLNEVGCGCGEPPRKAILIPPGKTKDVVVALDTRSEFGDIEKKISFTTNDPNQARFELTVLAKVKQK